MTADELADDTGRTFVSAVKAQGVPTVFGLLQGLDQVAPKQVTELKRQAGNWLDFEFSDEPRLFPCDHVQDMTQVLRFICATKVKTIHWRENRPYMLVEQLQFRGADGVRVAISYYRLRTNAPAEPRQRNAVVVRLLARRSAQSELARAPHELR
jgi:pre-rRNA-processing protein TSR1